MAVSSLPDDLRLSGLPGAIRRGNPGYCLWAERFALTFAPVEMASFAFAMRTFADSFEKAIRDDGSAYLKVREDWAKEIVRLAHDGEMPNDSRYEQISELASRLADNEYDSADDARNDVLDIALDSAPCHTGDLLRWFADHPARLQACDAARDEWGTMESIYDLLMDGCRYDAAQVLEIIIREVEEYAAELFNPDTDCRLLLSDGHGIYIPQMYCRGMDAGDAETIGVEWESVQTCQDGPDHPDYWEAWQDICDNACLASEGQDWRLVQNGDLWMVRDGVTIPDEWFF